MSKIELYIPKKDIKLFQTLAFSYLSDNQESHNEISKCDEAKECEEGMNPTSENDEEKDLDITASSSKPSKGEESKVKNENSLHDDDDDDGYHTPTSPRSRISPAIKCPPAPKISKIVKFRRVLIGIKRAKLEISNEELASLFGKNKARESESRRKRIRVEEEEDV